MVVILSSILGVSSQDIIAQASITDGNTMINQKAIYRFSLFIFSQDEEPFFPAGTVFKTYLADSVSLDIQNPIPICRFYDMSSDTTSNYTNCLYNATTRMISFSLTAQQFYSQTYDYEIGYIRNPGVSTFVSGFRFVVEDSKGTVLYQVSDGSQVIIQPGSITGQSVTTASLKVAQVARYTFKFQISNAVPGDGKIEIVFPQNEIDVPFGLLGSDTNVTVYDRPTVPGSIQLRKPLTITFNNSFGGQEINPDSNQFIEISINKIQNPKSTKTTQSFIIFTLDSNDNQIDQTTTDITVTTTQPADITVGIDQPKIMSSSVNALTNLQFDINLPFTFSGGYLLVTFPPEVRIPSTLNCLYQFGLSSTPPCTMVGTSPNKVKISNQILMNRLIFQIGLAQNPATNKPTSSFQIQAFDSTNFVISQKTVNITYTATPITLGTVTAIRTQAEVGKSIGNTLTITFSGVSPMLAGEKILLKIPYDQMTLTESNQISCRSRSSTNQLAATDCTLDIITNATYFLVSLGVPCITSCSGGTSYQIEISGVKNPDWIVSPVSKSIEVQTMSADLLWIKDRKLIGVFTQPSLIEGVITDKGITKVNQVVNQVTEFTLSFTTLTRITSNGYIRFYLPINGFFNPKIGSVSCQDMIAGATITCSSTLNTDSTKGIQYIQISGKCPQSNSCPAGTIMQFKITNIRNRPSVKNFTNAFEIRTYTAEDFKIDIAQITGISNLNLFTSNYTSISRNSPISPILTGALDNYEFKITSFNGIQSNNLGKMEITFPPEIIFITPADGSTPTCSSSAGTSTLTCKIINADKKLQITNSDLTKGFENVEITVTLPNLAKNPQTTKPSGFFKVQTSLLDQEEQIYYLQDLDLISLSVTSDTPNALSSVTATRSQFLINEQSEYSLSFTTFNPIPSGSIVSIQVPKDQVKFLDGQTRIITDTSSGNTLTSLSETGASDSTIDYVTFMVAEWCSKGATECPTGSILQFKISGVNNPPTTRPAKNSFAIVINTVDGYFIDQILKNVFATPLLSAGPFQKLEFSESNTAVGQLSVLSIQIKISNFIPEGHSGKLKLMLPSEMYYPPSDPNLYVNCESESLYAFCQTTTEEVSLGQTITSVSISMDCQNKGCLTDTIRNFKINNLRNRLSTKPFSATLSALSADDDDYTYDSSSKQLSATSLASILSPNINGLFQQLQRSNMTTSQTTELTLTYQISVRILKGSSFSLYIPKQPFELDPSSTLKCFTPQQTQISCTFIQDQPTYFGIQLKEFCVPSSSTIKQLYCPEAYQFVLKIQGFKNRYNTKGITTEKLFFKSFTSDQYQIEESQNLVVPPDDLKPSLIYVDPNYLLSNIYVGKLTDLVLNLNLQNKANQGDFLGLSFLNNFIFRPSSTLKLQCFITIQGSEPKLSSCSMTSSETEVKSVEVQLQQAIDPSNTNVTLKIQNLVNLLEDKPHSTVFSIRVYTKDASKSYGISAGALEAVNNNYLTPGPLEYLLMERSVVDIGQSTQVVMKMQTAIPIMPNSYFKLSIPKSQLIRNPSQSIDCTFQGSSLTLTQQQADDENYLYLTTPKVICDQISCALNSNLMLRMDNGFRNPYYLLTQQYPLIIDIISPNEYGIMTTKGDLSPALQLGELLNFNVTQTGSLAVGNLTSFNYTFKFKQRITTGYKVILQFPMYTLMNGFINGQAVDVQAYDYNTQQPFRTVVIQQKDGYITRISLENYCLITNCGIRFTQSFNLTGINNVDYGRYRSNNFSLFEVTPENYMTSEATQNETLLPAFLPSLISDIVVTRSATKPGQTAIELVISFKSLVKIPNKSLITYFIPKEQAVLSQFSRIVCMSVEARGFGVDLDCTVLERNATHTVLQLPEWCPGDCQINQTISMKIIKVTNPVSLEANNPFNSIGILVNTSTGETLSAVFSGVVAQPLLDGIDIRNAYLQREDNMLGIDDNFTVIFDIGETLSTNIAITFDLPLNVSFSPVSSSQACYLFKNNVLVQKTCTYTYRDRYIFGLQPLLSVVMPDFCSKDSPCVPNQQYGFKFQVSNPRSYIFAPANFSQSMFKLALAGDRYEVGIVRINNTLPQLRSGVISTVVRNDTVGSDCIKTGTYCPLTIDVVTQNAFSGNQNTYLLITLPDDLTITQTSACSGVIVQKNMLCRVVTTRQIQIRHNLELTNQEFKSMNYGFIIKVLINEVRYPYSTEETCQFKVATYETFNGNLLVIDQVYTSVTFRTSLPSTFRTITVNRTSTDPNTKTNLVFDLYSSNYIPKDGYIRVYLPPTQVVIDQGQSNMSPTCYKGTGATQILKCQFVEDKTIQIYDICQPNGCNTQMKIAFGIANTILFNPEFEQDPMDPTDDAVKVQVLTNSSRDGQTYQIQNNMTSLFVRPQLSYLETLRVSKAKIETDVASEQQIMTFRAQYVDRVFTREFLRLKFYYINFTADPLYPLSARVNNQTSTITNIGTLTGGTLDYLILSCTQYCKLKDALNIEIKGLRNQAYINRAQEMLPKYQFGELVLRPARMYTSNSSFFSEQATTMKQSKMLNPDVKLANYTPQAVNNSLTLLFSIQNNPYINQQTQITVKLPSQYRVPNTTNCSNIFTSQNYNCSVDTQAGVLTVYNYFRSQRQSNGGELVLLQRRGSRLLATTATTSAIQEIRIQNTVVALNITGITNPLISMVNATIEVTVGAFGSLFYIQDNTTAQVSSVTTQTDGCLATDCAECSQLDPRLCLKCLIPSDNPLGQGFECVSKCSSGYFLHKNLCYKCPYGCKNCTTFDQCSACLSNQTLVDGTCVDNISKFDQQLQCPKGSGSNSLYSMNKCVRTTGCAQSECEVCGADTDYCIQCKKGYVSDRGKCTNTCPAEFTSTLKGTCVKCEATCSECNQSSDRCTKCKTDVFAMLKLDTSKNVCTNKCADGTIMRGNDPNFCDSCAPSCYTCSKSKTTCDSCYFDRETFEDLFFLKNTCIKACPAGYKADFETHKCIESDYGINQQAPLYLILSSIISGIVILASNIRSGKKDSPIEIVIVAFTQIEFLNRILTISHLWKSTQVFSFCITGMNLLVNSLFGIYFATIVVWPVCKQLKVMPSKTKVFKVVLILVQFSGVNTIRLIYSGFFGLRSLSGTKIQEVQYFTTYLENMSALTIFLNFCQFFVGVGSLSRNPQESPQFGYGINCIILNLIISGLQYYKYREFLARQREYERVQVVVQQHQAYTVRQNRE